MLNFVRYEEKYLYGYVYSVAYYFKPPYRRLSSGYATTEEIARYTETSPE